MKKYQVRISTDAMWAGPCAGLVIADEDGVSPDVIPVPLLVDVTGCTDRQVGQAADSLLAELGWTRTGAWNVAGTWEVPGTHMYADVVLTAELAEWPVGKLFGELSPEQRQYQAAKPGRRLTAEMAQPEVVAAVSALLDEDDAAAVERHLGL